MVYIWCYQCIHSIWVQKGNVGHVHRNIYHYLPREAQVRHFVSKQCSHVTGTSYLISKWRLRTYIWSIFIFCDNCFTCMIAYIYSEYITSIPKPKKMFNIFQIRIGYIDICLTIFGMLLLYLNQSNLNSFLYMIFLVCLKVADVCKMMKSMIKTVVLVVVMIRNVTHDDVIKWKHFPSYWPFVRGIHRSPVNYPHKCQWRRSLMLSLICAWINGWVNNLEAGDLRRHRAHCDVIIMFCLKMMAARFNFRINFINRSALVIIWNGQTVN